MMKNAEHLRNEYAPSARSAKHAPSEPWHTLIGDGRAICCALVILLTAGCDRSSTDVEAGPGHPIERETPVERVVFPDNLRVDYEPVNEFISKALNACVQGDYESFRLLWSVKQDPLQRGEFEQGWRAVKTVRVRALEKVVLPSTDEPAPDHEDRSLTVPPGEIAPDVSFILLAEAEFDPNHPVGRRKPTREFVLMIVRETNGWRFGRASGPVRDWIKQQVSTNPPDAPNRDSLPGTIRSPG